jgi:hypothetical protein
MRKSIAVRGLAALSFAVALRGVCGCDTGLGTVAAASASELAPGNAGGALDAPRAAAVAPADCAFGKGAKFYEQGRSKGSKLVQKLWRGASCGRVEAFADQVIEHLGELELSQGEESRVHRWCRYAGSVEALWEGLDRIQLDCDAHCFMDGDFVGQVAAKVFCDLAIEALGALEPEAWLRPPVASCGFQYQLACDTRFLGTAGGYTNEEGVCAPYTEVPYTELFESARLRSCAFPAAE